MEILTAIFKYLGTISGGDLIAYVVFFICGTVFAFVALFGRSNLLRKKINNEQILPLRDALLLATAKYQDDDEGRFALGRTISLSKDTKSALEKLYPGIMEQFVIAEANYISCNQDLGVNDNVSTAFPD